MLGGDQDYSPAAGGSNSSSHEDGNFKGSRKKNKNKNSRRFSDEQIKSLESLFKMENKLEPRKKLEMARELGLQPRQVAIWFQNRRARWKSKQMEQQYRSLKADYDNLSDQFESLKKEKHALLIQLRNLCSQLKEPHEGRGGSKDLELGNSTDSGSENGETNFELNGNSSCFSGALEQDMAIYSDEDDLMKGKSYLDEHKESENLNMSEQVDGISEEPCNFDWGGLFDQSSCSTSSNWWDFWT